MVHDLVKYVACYLLTEMCSANKRLAFYHLINSLKAPYFTSLKGQLQRFHKLSLFDKFRHVENGLDINF